MAVDQHKSPEALVEEQMEAEGTSFFDRWFCLGPGGCGDTAGTLPMTAPSHVS